MNSKLKSHAKHEIHIVFLGGGLERELFFKVAMFKDYQVSKPESFFRSLECVNKLRVFQV